MPIQITLKDEFPARREDQDEAIMVIIGRRTDPDNGTGSPFPDLVNFTEASFGNGKLAEVAAKVADLITALGFNVDESFVSTPSLHDAEVGGGVTNLGVLLGLFNPPAPVEDPAPEDPPAEDPPAEDPPAEDPAPAPEG